MLYSSEGFGLGATSAQAIWTEPYRLEACELEQGRKRASGRKVGLYGNRCKVVLGSGKHCGVVQVGGGTQKMGRSQ